MAREAKIWSSALILLIFGRMCFITIVQTTFLSCDELLHSASTAPASQPELRAHENQRDQMIW